VVSDQKERQDLGFNSSFEPVAPRRPVEQLSVPRPTGVLGAKPWLIVVGLLVVAAAVFGLMKLLSSAGKDIAAHNSQVVGEIDHAKDSAAQVTAQTALQAAKTLFVTNASYADVSPASLSAAEPTYRYTSAPSTGQNVVSVSSSATEIGLAVSTGKMCWYLSDSETGGTKYGSGKGACTGAAAIKIAKASAW
jgi:hypothetical protein